MENAKIYLVRSPAKLIADNLAGYGWPQVNFSEAEDTKGLMALFAEKGINPGRHRNQIKRFFSMKSGDIVVVPLHRAVAFGIATGKRSYATGIGYGENRTGVEYLRHDDGSVIRVPRTELPEALSTRLRIRMSVVSLDEFKDDIIRIIDQTRVLAAPVSTPIFKNWKLKHRSTCASSCWTTSVMAKPTLPAAASALKSWLPSFCIRKATPPRCWPKQLLKEKRMPI